MTHPSLPSQECASREGQETNHSLRKALDWAENVEEGKAGEAASQGGLRGRGDAGRDLKERTGVVRGIAGQLTVEVEEEPGTLKPQALV